MIGKFISLKQLLYTAPRFLIIMALAVVIAKPLNKEIYDNYYQRALFKVHTTDLNFLSDQLRNRFSFLLLMNDIVELQRVLDSNFGVFGFVITDCKTEQGACPGQRIVYSSSPDLNWRKFPSPEDLHKEPYIPLLGPDPLSAEGKHPVTQTSTPEVIGRLYIISNMPRSFDEDYGLWLSAPLKSIGAWRYYLKTMGFCLMGGFLTWLIVELSLGIRRIQLWNAREREYQLINNADSYLKMLEEKNYQLEEQNRFSTGQFETYLDRIKELEQREKDDSQYKSFTEAFIQEIEEARREQSVKLNEELHKTKQEMQLLREKIAEFEGASEKDKRGTYTALESAVKTQFSNAFEQKIVETISKSPKYLRGEWLTVHNFNVGAGKKSSQFADCIVISKECLVVIEAKNYVGTIDSDGDFENDKWVCRNSMGVREVASLWGDNPFHQVYEYSMSLMHIVKKRSQWNIAVFGVIAFPEGADLSVIGGQLGKFYRVTTADRLVAVLENIEAEARRSNRFGKRPSPQQIENLIRGRNV